MPGMLTRVNSLMIQTGKSDKKLLLFFIVTAIVFKCLTFWFSVIDIDESTYLLIGKEVVNGKLLYVDCYDTKPIGIFLIFGLIDFLTGNGIVFSRILAAVLVGITAYMIFKLKLKTSSDRYASIFAGLAYLILASMYRFTYAANTELFFIFFTVLSFYIFFKWKHPSKYFVGGLIAGIGFIIKYLVAFDLLAFGLFLVYLFVLGKMKFVKLIQAGIIMIIGFVLPVGFVTLTYWSMGHFEEFRQFSFSFLMNYQGSNTMQKYFDFILDIHLKYLPAFIFFYYLLILNIFKIRKQPIAFFKVSWFALTVIAVVSLKKSNTHYFIQIFPVMSYILADIFIFPNKTGNYIKNHTTTFFVWLMIVLLIISLVNQSYYIFRKDIPKEISIYLKKNLDEGEIVYVSGYKHIIYYLIGQSPPTPYVHPTMFVYKYHIEGLHINTYDEVGKVLQKLPKYIIYRIDPYMHGHEEYFYVNYEEVKVFDEAVFIYKLAESENGSVSK